MIHHPLPDRIRLPHGVTYDDAMNTPKGLLYLFTDSGLTRSSFGVLAGDLSSERVLTEFRATRHRFAGSIAEELRASLAVAMAEDEAMRGRQPTFIGQLRHDHGLDPSEELPMTVARRAAQESANHY